MLDALKNFTQEIKQKSYLSANTKHSSTLKEIKNGLYCLVFINSSTSPIRDKNKKNIPHPFLGKIVIPPKSTSIKFGKFENGFFNRMKQYNKHFHYECDPRREIFSDVLFSAYALNLDETQGSNSNIIASRIYEQYWNQLIHKFLIENGLLSPSQNIRSEYRTIETDLSMQEINTRLEIEMNEISKAIFKSSDILI